MLYVIFDDVNRQFVTRRRNVSYPLFTSDFKKARFYKSKKSACTFAHAIIRNGYHGLTELVILSISYQASSPFHIR